MLSMGDGVAKASHLDKVIEYLLNYHSGKD